MSKKTTVIEERRKALQQYLRDLAKIEVVRNSQIFRDFLDFDRNLSTISAGGLPSGGVGHLMDEDVYVGRKSGIEGSPNIFACDEELALPPQATNHTNKENRQQPVVTTTTQRTSGSIEALCIHLSEPR
jgi:hypothetical protein